ncbi:BTB/POZ domain-containing protein At5g48130 [Selaginella moellendorffii]|uniref:BTB/POZ domain-containing protein At5g48130 n=1 Tax=Selaginella moellendorffii TaxID=88036 RepID=UPI000D1CFCBC|nr:BTB/POZ domain-containing protein At5g48130 [Selaginella moellendorffii]|eukprot:XP_024528342.1 BTB/POZ domain-containing protein At5g48130 [Selaginella moellendorffii]
MAAFSQPGRDLQDRDVKKRVNPIYDEDEEFYQSESSANLSSDFYDDLSRPGKMDTIYESFEEFVDSSDERSNGASSTDCTSSSARVSADSPTSILRRSVRAWCDATGLPTTVHVEIKERSFGLHKFPLTSRSGLFKRLLSDQTYVKLGDDFPGGSEVFELIASFCYGSTIHIDVSNVAVLRCCAELLEMTEEYRKGNLSGRTEDYLTQVVFKSWVDTLSVLQQCAKLVPAREAFQIISRGIDSLAAAVCKGLRQERVSVTSENDRCSMVKDILELPVTFFDRLVNGLRKQGLDEKPVSQLILDYIKRWVLGTKEGTDVKDGDVHLIEATVRLLPLERFLVPIKVLLSLHGCAFAWNASKDCRLQLEARIVSQLELATVDDFLMSLRTSKNSRAHMDSMRQIVSEFMSQQEILLDGSEMLLTERELRSASSYSFLAVSAVVKVWDEYLAEIASDPEVGPRTFVELTEAVPSNIRPNHDLLYRAIHAYFQSHPSLSHADRVTVCQGLNCQKLSREICMHAVQNELMPLRMIVQAMFVQQLESRGAEHLDNPLRPVANVERRTNPSIPSQAFGREARDDGLPLGVILQRDAAFREAAFLKDDFEATKARLKELEQELMRMKMTMDVDRPASNGNHGGRPAFMDGKGRKKLAGSCMYQVWGAQTSGIRFGQRITKTFQKLGLGSFWKPRPSGAAQQRTKDHTSAGVADCKVRQWQDEQDYGRQQQQELEAGTPLRASSFRKVEGERSSGVLRRHARHHSFS